MKINTKKLLGLILCFTMQTSLTVPAIFSLRKIDSEKTELQAKKISNLIWQTTVRQRIILTVGAAASLYGIYYLFAGSSSTSNQPSAEIKITQEKFDKLVNAINHHISPPANATINVTATAQAPQSSSWSDYIPASIRKLGSWSGSFVQTCAAMAVSNVLTTTFFRTVDRIMEKGKKDVNKIEQKFDLMLAKVFHPTDIRWFSQVYVPFDDTASEIENIINKLETSAGWTAINEQTYNTTAESLTQTWELTIEMIERLIAFMHAKTASFENSYPTTSSVLRRISDDLIIQTNQFVSTANNALAEPSAQTADTLRKAFTTFKTEANVLFERFAKFERFVAF